MQVSFINWASRVPDPRIDRRKLYPLVEILFIALCSFLSGSESFYDMERFGNRKLSWLKRFLPYANGIPSHDTFARVFSLLDPKLFASWFQHWAHTVRVQPGQIAVDAGSFVGYKAMAMADLVGPSGRVLAIELDPESFDRQQR